MLLIGIAMLSIAVSRDGGTPAERTRAIYCIIMECIGILLMTAGALPALYAVFSVQPLSQITYVGLMFVFAIGGLLFLRHDAYLQQLNTTARETAETIFFYTWKLMGTLTVVFTGLSLFVHSITATAQADGWWVAHLTMLLYGLILCWFTLHRTPTSATPPKTSRILLAKKGIQSPTSRLRKSKS